jgi:hypothetical protein
MNSGKKIVTLLLNSLILLFTIHCLLFTLSSCGGGDDDGRRLGELIVGNWQRGWGEGDVVIEGDTQWHPEDFSYDIFVFHGDGDYNGMVRNGSFSAYDYFGEILYEGTYRCDNHNLKLEFMDESGRKQTILAQVQMFTEDTLIIKYENGDYGISVTLTLRKAQSSSSTSAS